MHGCTESDYLVWIQTGVRNAAKQVLHQLPHFRNARGAAHQYHFVNLRGFEVGVFERLLAGTNRAINDRLDQLLERLLWDLALVAFPAGQFDVECCGRLR